MQTHKLKCWPEFFEAMLSGKKTFDLRLNDRDFHVNDIAKNREWNPDTQEYTGRGLDFKIVYITKGLHGHLGVNMVCLQYEPIESKVSLGFLPQEDHTIKMLMSEMEKYNIKRAFAMITHSDEDIGQLAIDVYKVVETFRPVDKLQEQNKL